MGLFRIISYIYGTLIILFITRFDTLEAISELESAVLKAKGYYQDTAKSKSLSLEKTVLVTGGNFGYLNHIQNFKCFADRLNLQFLVISMDFRTHSYLTRRGMVSFFLGKSSNAEINGDSFAFRHPQFNEITNRKKKAVADILELGYDVIFADCDVVFVRDPLPFIRFSNVDYVHSLNVLCPFGNQWNFYTSHSEGNTGFYFARLF